MEATEQKVEVHLPDDLAKRYTEAKTPLERNTVLAEFAAQRGAESQTVEQHARLMNDEQFRSLISEFGKVSAAEARKAVAEIAGENERKYKLDGDKAEQIAEESFKDAEVKMRNEQADKEMAAKVFRGMFLAKTGHTHAYRQAIEEEGEHYQKRYGRKTRAMSLATDSTAGYLAPTLFSDWLYENIARTSLVRRFCKMIPMNRNEVINIPTVTTGLSAGVVAEAAASTGVQPVFSQKQLGTKKIMTKTRPISIEMIEKAHPAIIDLLIGWAIDEIKKAEDSLVFGTTGNGIRASSTNLVPVGTAASGFASIVFDELIDMESELDPQYLADDDIQGSGIITGVPQYVLPHALIQNLKKKKETGTGAYLDEAKELRNLKSIFGYRARRGLSLPNGTSLASGDKVGIFGNLQHVWCGVEAGFRIDMLTEGTIDDNGTPVSLADTAQAAVRVLEFFDSVVVDPEALSIAQMA